MTSYTSLETLPTKLKADETTCALAENRKPLNWKQWKTRFYQWRQVLTTQRGERWGIYEENCFEFSAILLALWSLNKKAYLPGNCQPGHIDLLSKYVDGFIGSIDNERTLPAPAIDSDAPASPHDLATLNTREQLLFLFTSGSTGTPRPIGKNLTQISTEIDTLHRQWGNQVVPVHVIASVSHQHIYGLLFRCLWPLLEGWSFDTHARQYTETFSPPENHKGILVSSPTHLSRLSSNGSSQNHTLVFSSGAPLDYLSSQQAARYFECSVTEVFGSTETGGIAWRQQNLEENSPWTVFEGVEFKSSNAEQQLSIRSPYLETPSQWLITNDRVTYVNNRQFLLIGRTDRILKVEGKRLSLDEMESHLKSHPLIEDAHIVQLDGIAGRLGAVVSFKKEAPPSHRSERRVRSKELKTHLLKNFERPTLPRKWRYVAALPRSTQGKLASTDMKQLFDKKHERPTEAVLVATQKLDDQFVLSLIVPENLIYFDGHFDQSPILPGVVQLQWAEKYARELFKLSTPFKRLEALKFQKIATPGIKLKLSLSYSEKDQKILFKYTSSIGQHASGRIALGS